MTFPAPLEFSTLEKIAAIRPPATWQDLADKFSSSELEGLKRNLSGVELRFRDEMGDVSHDWASGVLQVIGFGPNFPSDISWYGLHLGQRIEDSLLSLESFAISQVDATSPDGERYWVKTPDETELFLIFFRRELKRVWVCELGFRAIFEYREDVRLALGNARRARSQLSEKWFQEIGNLDQMLLTWACFVHPTDPKWSDEFVKFATWLRKAPSIARHQAALSWNWDYGICPLLYIIEQKDCDLATLAEIYAISAPEISDLTEPVEKYPKDNWDASFLRKRIIMRLNDAQLPFNIYFDFNRRKQFFGPSIDLFGAIFKDRRCGNHRAANVTWGRGLPYFNIT